MTVPVSLKTVTDVMALLHFVTVWGHRSTVTIVKWLISGVRIYHDRLVGHKCASRNHILLARSQVKMEHEGVDECGLDKLDSWFDWKYWRRFEAIDQERKRKREALMAEERDCVSTLWSVHIKMEESSRR